MIPPISVVRPETVAEALSCIDDEARPYCGGTELLLAMKEGLLAPSTLVDLKGITELQSVDMHGDFLAIGGTVTHQTAVHNALVNSEVPLLARVESSVGNPRVRSQGSIAGNLCFAEPKSDSITVLIALDAHVVLESAQGRRQLPVAEFIQGAYDTVLGEQELLTTILVPRHGGQGVHLKYQVTERPTASVVIADRGDGIRIVIGAAGEVPVWQDVADASAVDVSDMVSRLDPLDDLSGSADYKRHICDVFVRRALSDYRGVNS